FSQADQRHGKWPAGENTLIGGGQGVVLEQKRDDVGIHNYRRCGVHQRATGRDPSLRSRRIKATNSSAPCGSCSVSRRKSSALTGGLSMTPAKRSAWPLPVSFDSDLRDISIPV